MAKRMISARLSEASHDKLTWLRDRYGTQTSALEVAIDRLYNSERSTMARMNYEAVDETVLARARAVHSEVCGCDDKRCTLTGEIYDWLAEGDGGEGRTVDDLVAEWHEVNDTDAYT